MAETIDEKPSTAESDGEEGSLPTITDASIGLAIGVGLLLLGLWFTTWWLRWPTIILGVLFVLVMGAYIVASTWEKVSKPANRVVARVRGHTRMDPVLGTLTRDVKAHGWEATFESPTGTVEFLIDGADEPAPALVARARELVAEFPSLQPRIADFLGREAAVETDAEMVTQIKGLRVSMFRLHHPDRPDEVEIVFDGPDEDLWWTCMYVRGELDDLQFDS